MMTSLQPLWVQAPLARDALLEVEALLDHLFEHPNTPVFVAYRLIQRFVTSNPSKDYVSAVSEAFKTGVWIGDSAGRFAGWCCS